MSTKDVVKCCSRYFPGYACAKNENICRGCCFCTICECCHNCREKGEVISIDEEKICRRCVESCDNCGSVQKHTDLFDNPVPDELGDAGCMQHFCSRCFDRAFKHNLRCDQ